MKMFTTLEGMNGYIMLTQPMDFYNFGTYLLNKPGKIFTRITHWRNDDKFG